ncbi:DUF5704 domain-containing protein [Paenibacillus turpanensis]|uniref:DUF5704 domain-containing protein n=1 Tax=Paenibacillus turpanensis TaxID=2689078 RepID=UPI003C7D5361
MKRLTPLVIIILIAVTLSNNANVFGDTAVGAANKEIFEKYGYSNYYDIEKVNAEVWKTKNRLVYGSPHGTYKQNEYRYLGYTNKGEEYPNNDYPYDDAPNPGSFFNNYTWVADPWKNETVKSVYPNVKKTVFDDYRSHFRANFIEGMKREHGAHFKEDVYVPWENYYHIVVPSTKHTWGVARMWHIRNSKLWYIDVGLAPDVLLNPDSETFVSTPEGDAVLKAMDRGAEKYDVSLGIPSSEELYANVTNAKQYMHEFGYQSVSGYRTYYITVSKQYRSYWYVQVPDYCTRTVSDGKGGSHSETYRCGSHTETRYGSYSTFTRTYPVMRPYKYYQINRFGLYKLDHADIQNGALPGGTVRLDPNGYSPPSADVWHSPDPDDHYKEAPVTSYSVDLGRDSVHRDSWGSTNFYSGFSSAAEAQVGKVQVRNDRLILNHLGTSTVVMNDGYRDEQAPTPSPFPDAPKVGADMLYETNLRIPDITPNKDAYESTGSISYTMVSSVGSPSSSVEVPIHPNSVTVHTPVVNYMKIPHDNRRFDQRKEPDLSRPPLILSRTFSVEIPEEGKHREILGYHTRNYGAYIRDRGPNLGDKGKYVLFPFDVTNEDQSIYYPANKWIEFPKGQTSVTYRLPEWVDEGNYTVRTKVLALNDKTTSPDAPETACQKEANLELANTCAVNDIEVGVVGRMYGFQVSDIGDPRYKEVFRTAEGALSGNRYVTGPLDQNALETSYKDKPIWFLPVRQGSHPTQKRTVVHSGYSFDFQVTTIGNYYNHGEGVVIKPSFRFVSKKGGASQEVDLYYNATDANKMVKVGSEEDKLLYLRTYKLFDPIRGITEEELKGAGEYEYKSIVPKIPEQATLTEPNFMEWFRTRPINIARGYGEEILSYKTRTLIGRTIGPAATAVDPLVVRRSVQRWYGEYHVPIAPYVLPKGTDIGQLAINHGGYLTGKEPEFLRDGYIIVNFELYTVREMNEEKKILAYDARTTDEIAAGTHRGNMWEIEGYIPLKDTAGVEYTTFGDIILYDVDYSATNDVQGSGQ